MIAMPERLASDFLPRFLAGMAVNFEIAVLAIVMGLGLGLVLAWFRDRGGALGTAATALNAVMRAAPTFVVMFFLLNVIPRDASLFGAKMALTGVMTVALSLVPYSASFVADSGVEALGHLRRRTPLGALLFLPNVTRAFFVLVMSSSAGAAIGVVEGVTVILRQAELLPLGDRFALFAIGILFFGIPLQGAFAVIGLIHRHLGRILLRSPAVD